MSVVLNAFESLLRQAAKALALMLLVGVAAATVLTVGRLAGAAPSTSWDEILSGIAASGLVALTGLVLMLIARRSLP